MLISLRIVPNYELAPALQDVEILRVVVKENFTEVVCYDSVGSIYSLTKRPR